ncbi:MAG TPA: acyl-CoA dehydrogenase family protein [Acidimicrobiales bacterium]|nr:acyl-CoA dehydrogenase family protein [Acidimicrobiales bacterium]
MTTTYGQGPVAQLARQVGLEVLGPAARIAESQRAVPEEVWNVLFETGLTMPIDEQYGGGGVPDSLEQMEIAENLAYGDPGIAVAALSNAAAPLLIGRVGDASQREALSLLARDVEARSSVALFEGYGRSPSEYETSFTPIDNGLWRIVGQKLVVPFASEANPLLVVGISKSDGTLKAAVLDAHADGIETKLNTRALALDAMPTFTMHLDAAVASENLLGGVEADADELASGIAHYRLLLAAVMVGTAQRANDYASQYATERVAFGRPIAAFQGISFLLAEAQIRIESARLSIREAAFWLKGSLAFQQEVTRIVNYAGVVATQSTRDAVQVLGGHGFIADHPVELWYRSAAALSTFDFDPLYSNFEPAL